MKWNELRKLAELQGFKFKKHGGNHDVYENDKGIIILIGRHGSQEVPTGTCTKVKKQIGL